MADGLRKAMSTRGWLWFSFTHALAWLACTTQPYFADTAFRKSPAGVVSPCYVLQLCLRGDRHRLRVSVTHALPNYGVILILTGLWRAIVVPSPSLPLPFRPQAQSSPFVVIATL